MHAAWQPVLPGCSGVLQAQGCTSTRSASLALSLLPGRPAETPLLAHCAWSSSPSRCQPGCAPRRCVLWGQTPFEMSRYLQDFSKLFILTPSHSVAVQLCTEFALGYDVQGSGNEREYFAFEKEMDRVCCVKFRDIDMKKNVCACDEKLPVSSSHVIGMRALALCKIMMLVTEGIRERRGMQRHSP